MIDAEDWRKSAEHHFRAGVADLIEALGEVAPSDPDAHEREWREAAEERRSRARIAGHVPIEVSNYFLALREKKMPRADTLKKIIEAASLKKIWERAESNSYFALPYAVDATDAADRAEFFKRGPATGKEHVGQHVHWTPSKQKKHFEHIAKTSRSLAAALLNSPGAYGSAFSYFDEAAAQRIANHAMQNPLGSIIASIPRTAQEATEQALPAASSMPVVLEKLAIAADQWAKHSKSSGNRDEQQHARIFVRHLYEIAIGRAGVTEEELRAIVGKTCIVLMDVSFTASQLKEHTSP